MQLDYKESQRQRGKLLVHNTTKRDYSTTVRQVPCFSLESILLALDWTHVDYFSLDVEGVELDILNTIPFDRIQIDVLSVEYRHGTKEDYVSLMESRGYVVYQDIFLDDPRSGLSVEDFIFVRKEIAKKEL